MSIRLKFRGLARPPFFVFRMSVLAVSADFYARALQHHKIHVSCRSPFLGVEYTKISHREYGARYPHLRS
jgi:hypothetical protein